MVDAPLLLEVRVAGTAVYRFDRRRRTRREGAILRALWRQATSFACVNKSILRPPGRLAPVSGDEEARLRDFLEAACLTIEGITLSWVCAWPGTTMEGFCLMLAGPPTSRMPHMVDCRHDFGWQTASGWEDLNLFQGGGSASIAVPTNGWVPCSEPRPSWPAWGWQRMPPCPRA